jgi:hypothetical protein
MRLAAVAVVGKTQRVLAVAALAATAVMKMQLPERLARLILVRAAARRVLLQMAHQVLAAKVLMEL